jgi:hypothetical protein
MLKKNATVFFLYCGVFAALFAVFPITGTLPGNCDTWGWLVFWNMACNDFVSFFTGEFVGRALYPVKSMYDLGESALGNGMVFIAARMAGLGDVAAYYVFLVVSHALTALGLCLFASRYTGRRSAAVFAGFAYMAANFALANLDDAPVCAAAYIPFFAWYLLLRYSEEKRSSLLFFSALLMGWQIYFGLYIFCYFFLGYILLAFFHARGALRENPGHALLAAALGTGIAAPYLIKYLSVYAVADYLSPAPRDMALTLSCLRPSSFLGVLPGNLLYPYNPFGKEMTPWWPSVRTLAFPGLLFTALGLFGAARNWRRFPALPAIGTAGLLLSVNTSFHLAGFHVPSFLETVYSWFPVLGVLRVPLRAYCLTLAVCAVFGALSLEAFLKKLGGKKACALALGLAAVLHLVENAPFPLARYRYFAPPPGLAEFFAGKRGALVLHMPSYFINQVEGDTSDLFYLARELVYANWQCYHKKDVLNGVNGYIPKTRAVVQEFIDRLPEREAFLAMGPLVPDYIVYHNDMELPRDRPGIRRLLAESPYLTEVLSTERMTVYRVTGFSRHPGAGRRAGL